MNAWKISTSLFAVLLLSCAARGQQPYHILDIIPNQSGAAVGEIRFVESSGWTSGTGTGYVGFRGPATIGSNVIWTLPATDGTTGQALITDGAGVLSWGAGGGGGSLTVQDDDATPSYSSISTLQFDQDDGFVVSEPVAGTARVDLSVSPAGFPTLLTIGRLVSTSSPLTGGGQLDANLTLACATCVTTDTTQTISGVKTLSTTIFTRSVIPSSDGDWLMGNSGINWIAGYFDALLVGTNASNTGQVAFYHSSTAGSIALRADNLGGTVGLEVGGRLYPSTNGTVLGDASFRWGMWGTFLDLSGDSSVQNSEIRFALNPDFNGGAVIGGSSLRFSNVYTQDLNISGTCTGCPGGTVSTSSPITGDGSGGSPVACTLCVRTDNAQTITGAKTLSALTTLSGNLYLSSQLRTNQHAGSGSPAEPATHKIAVYDSGGAIINYLYLYP